MAVQVIGSDESRTIPLPDGEAGTAKTVRLIRRLVEDGVKNPRVRRTAVDILQSVPPWNDAAEVQAIYQWVLSNIRYTKDMMGVGHAFETLQPPDQILIARAGDCDDLNAILLPSLLGAVGYETRLVTVASDQADPGNYSHIYSEVLVNGQWIALDAARPDAAFARAPEIFWKRRYWGLTGVSGMNGVGCPHMVCSPRVPARGTLNGLGEIDWGSLIPAITSGTSQIIYAGKGIPYNPQYPYGMVPAGGYPGTAYGQTGSTYVQTPSQNIWLAIGVGVLVLFLVSRR